MKDIKNYTPNKEKCCINCKYYDERTHFCRLNPPTPMIFYSEGKQNVSSKFPVITQPTLDYCSFFKIRVSAPPDSFMTLQPLLTEATKAPSVVAKGK